ncbi:MAG: 4Fe-4S binding protein [Kiritimatiellae bacterium]|nr:4Fe-4S binding protein [Kiritimatiellia bacterium]
MKLPCLFQFRILSLAIRSFFARAFTTRFPAAPYEPIRQFRGRPRYHAEDCIGCGACAEVCPAEAIKLVDDLSGPKPARRLTQYLDTCIQCGQCERYCPTEKGIKLSNEYDYAGFSKSDFEESVEKDLLLCECCGAVIAPLDQLRWLVRRLGPLAFTNPTLMLVSARELAVVGENVKIAADKTVRAARVSIQCPKCRRKSALAV